MTGFPRLEIRAYRASDRAALVALWESCGLLRPWNDPVADIALCLATPHADLFVGLEPEPAGTLSAAVMCGSDGHRGWLYYLAVAPGRRHSGLARAMVRHAEARLAERGVRKVQLMIRAENDAVREVYEHLGYQAEPRVVMSRRLDASSRPAADHG